MSESWIQILLGVLAVVGSIVALGRAALGTVNKMLAQNAAREIATREEWKATQGKFLTILENHFAHDQDVLAKINEHMGSTNEVLRGLRDLVIMKRT